MRSRARVTCRRNGTTGDVEQAKPSVLTCDKSAKYIQGDAPTWGTDEGAKGKQYRLVKDKKVTPVGAAAAGCAACLNEIYKVAAARSPRKLRDTGIYIQQTTK